MTANHKITRAARRQLSGVFLFMALILPVCACAPEMRFETLREGIESRGHYIDGVPFLRQPVSSCGPAALATVFSFLGRSVEIEAIKRTIYLPSLQGTLPSDMERYPRSQGFQVTPGPNTYDALAAALRENVPVICLLDLGYSMYKQPHYVTVIGYDDVRGAIIMHDGESPNRVLSKDRFLSAWSRTRNWMMVVKP